MQQLPLNLHIPYLARLDDFIWRANESLEASINQFLHLPDEQFLYIYGAAGAGKSHILQGSCYDAQENGLQALYLPLKMLIDMPADCLEHAEDCDLLAIDDIDIVAGNALWEEQLFHLFNRFRLRPGHKLLMASLAPPKRLGILLPDLASRLSAGLCLPLVELDDAGKILLLQNQAINRGFDLSHHVAEYLLVHCNRSIHALKCILDTLDTLSLAERRKITIPFVKKILARQTTNHF